MNRQYIRDNGVIERYLSGQLSAAEEQALEEAYLADPDLLAELEATERLRAGIKDLSARGELKRARGTAGWLGALASPQYAAAASVLVAVSLALSGVLYRENVELRQQQGSSTATAMSMIPIENVRGAAAIEVAAPAENEMAGLLVDAGADGYDSYRVVILRRGEEAPEEIASAVGLSPDFQSQLAVAEPGRLLTPGLYEIEVEGRMRDWPADRDSAPVSRMLVRFVAPDSLQ
jgi:hypothetical protein